MRISMYSIIKNINSSYIIYEFNTYHKSTAAFILNAGVVQLNATLTFLEEYISFGIDYMKMYPDFLLRITQIFLYVVDGKL